MKINKIKLIKLLRRTTSFVLLLLFFLTLTSCKKEITIKDPIALGYIDNTAHIINKDNNTLTLDEYDQVLPIFDTYLMVKKDGKWGFISNTGETATKIIYDKISPMKENKAVVELEGQTLIINSKGETLYTFTNNYSSYSYFNENKLIIEKDGLLGYLEYNDTNHSFNVLVEPTYQYADFFYEGKAAVGILVDDKVKYSYINSDGTLFYSEFIFDEADRFSEGFAKVGTFTTNMVYKYIKNELSDTSELQYLTYASNNKVIAKAYGTRMQNGMIFGANYQVYDFEDDNEATDYYKDYQFITSNGDVMYETELSNFAKPTPQSFLPMYPLYLEDTFIFLNGSRRTSVWNIVRHTTYQLFNDITNEYYEDYDFINVGVTLSEDDPIIKEFLEINKYTFKFASTYLGSPYEMGEIKLNETLNQHIVMARIYGNKCGLISISTTPNVDPKPNNLDKQNVVVKYITSIIYDNIVY